MKSSNNAAPAAGVPWAAQSFRQFPSLTAVYLLGVVLAMALSLAVLSLANGQRVDSWPVGPAVYLSIITTLSGIMLRSSFRSTADSYLWSLLLSDKGASLANIHTVWDLGYQAKAIVNVRGNKFEPFLRLAALFMILVAANGPLLQRAVTVDLDNFEVQYEQTLAIRREPIWNLTSKWHYMASSSTFSASQLQEELAEVVLEHSQRQPMKLETDSCPESATCRVTVTVAGFSRACTNDTASYVGIESLPVARVVPLNTNYLATCSVTGRRLTDEEVEEDGMNGKGNPGACQALETEYQLGVEVSSRSDIRGQQHEVNQDGGPDEPQWQDRDLPPDLMDYTNYVQEGKLSDGLTVRRCNFSTAFIEIPIEITDGDTVRMAGAASDRDIRVVESIPRHEITSSCRRNVLDGFGRAMSDLYAGYAFYYDTYATLAVQGVGPRQQLKETRYRDPDAPDDARAFENFYTDPLNGFTDTLHELSLRYALKKIPTTEGRLEEFDKCILGDSGDEVDGLADAREQRFRALRAMSTKSGPEQTVSVRETQMVAVYRSHYLYAAISVALSYITTILLFALNVGWRSLGRSFSMSPLEIAKAFDAPLLRDAGSNISGDQIAREFGDEKVRYGEPTAPGPAAVDGDGEERQEYPTKEAATTDIAASDDSVTRTPVVSEKTRLLVDFADRVSTPVNGRSYE